MGVQSGSGYGPAQCYPGRQTLPSLGLPGPLLLWGVHEGLSKGKGCATVPGTGADAASFSIRTGPPHRSPGTFGAMAVPWGRSRPITWPAEPAVHLCPDGGRPPRLRYALAVPFCTVRCCAQGMGSVGREESTHMRTAYVGHCSGVLTGNSKAPIGGTNRNNDKQTPLVDCSFW